MRLTCEKYKYETNCLQAWVTVLLVKNSVLMNQPCRASGIRKRLFANQCVEVLRNMLK